MLKKRADIVATCYDIRVYRPTTTGRTHIYRKEGACEDKKKESIIMIGFINNGISLENMSLDIWVIALLNLLFCAILISPLCNGGKSHRVRTSLYRRCSSFLQVFEAVFQSYAKLWYGLLFNCLVPEFMRACTLTGRN